MDIFDSILLGIIQGLTEFLPDVNAKTTNYTHEVPSRNIELNSVKKRIFF